MGETGRDKLESCWAELHPIALAVTMALHTAPLPDNERAGLCLLALTHFISAAALEFQVAAGGKGALESHAREACDLALAAAFAPKSPVLKIVGGGNG